MLSELRLHPIAPVQPPSTFLVNNSNELGPVEELALPANETSVTLSNLKFSTRYKFYLNAKTVRGAGPAITQEAVTVMDEGKPPNTDGWKLLQENKMNNVSNYYKRETFAVTQQLLISASSAWLMLLMGTNW